MPPEVRERGWVCHFPHGVGQLAQFGYGWERCAAWWLPSAARPLTCIDVVGHTELFAKQPLSGSYAGPAPTISRLLRPRNVL
jgi:hypothetical protein